MTYEVYIDVRHHPRHLDDYEERLSTAFKLAKPEGATPPEAEKLRAVVYALRDWADELEAWYRPAVLDPDEGVE